MIKIDLEKFKKLKKKTEIYYKKINSVYCPALKSNIMFNSNGFIYNIMMEIINRTIRKPSEHGHIFQIKDISDETHTFVEHIKGSILTKGLDWVLKELESGKNSYGNA